VSSTEKVGCAAESPRAARSLRVRVGKGVGFIPKHPMDIKGHRPLNAKDGVLVLDGKAGRKSHHETGAEVLQIEKNLPAGYEEKWAKNVPKVMQPVIEFTQLKGASGPVKR